MDKKADNIEMHDIEHSFESPITSEKKVNWMKILLVVGVVVVFSAISFYLGRSNQEKIDESASGSTTTQPSTSPGQALKPGWTTYVHPVYKYRVNLPPGWSAYTKTYDPTKQIELRSDDYTEVVSPEGVAFQKSGKRIFFEYKSKLRKLTDYKITDQKSIEWLGTNATFIKGDGNDGTDTPSTMLLTTDVNGETYQLYWPFFINRDEDLFIEIAQSMSLGQSDMGDDSSAQENMKGWLKYEFDGFQNTWTGWIWKPFVIYYPPTWSISENIKDETNLSFKLTLKKDDGSRLSITQGFGEGGRCLYPEDSDYSTFQGMGQQYASYEPIMSGTYSWRLSAYKMPDELWTHAICELNPQTNKYQSGSNVVGIDTIKLMTPESKEEFIQMLKKIEIK